jgi:hypothetical protein
LFTIFADFFIDFSVTLEDLIWTLVTALVVCIKIDRISKCFYKAASEYIVKYPGTTKQKPVELRNHSRSYTKYKFIFIEPNMKSIFGRDSPFNNTRVLTSSLAAVPCTAGAPSCQSWRGHSA